MMLLLVCCEFLEKPSASAKERAKNERPLLLVLSALFWLRLEVYIRMAIQEPKALPSRSGMPPARENNRFNLQESGL